jgi:hypothetical protein
MPQAKGESNLRVAALIDCNAGRLTGHRFAAVGANNEQRAQCVAALELNACGVVGARRDSHDLVFDKPEFGQRTCALFQRSDQMSVFDIVTESIQVDFMRRKFHLRRAPKPLGIVDDAHDFERRCMGRARLPDAKCLERRDGTCQQSRGAVIRPGGPSAHERR